MARMPDPDAHVQKGLAGAGAAAGGQLCQAKGCRGMMAGAETETGIQPHHPLAGTRPPAAPARFDEQRAADFHRLEMALPRFRPVFAPQFLDDDARPGPATTRAARGSIGPARLTGRRAQGGRVNRDGQFPGAGVVIGCGGNVKVFFQQTGNRLLPPGGGGDGDLPQGRRPAACRGIAPRPSQAWSGFASPRRNSAIPWARPFAPRIARRHACQLQKQRARRCRRCRPGWEIPRRSP